MHTKWSSYYSYLENLELSRVCYLKILSEVISAV